MKKQQISITNFLIPCLFQWNISDYFYQNQEKLRASLTSDNQVFPDFPGVPNMPPFDKLWMCLYARLGC